MFVFPLNDDDERQQRILYRSVALFVQHSTAYQGRQAENVRAEESDHFDHFLLLLCKRLLYNKGKKCPPIATWSASYGRGVHGLLRATPGNVVFLVVSYSSLNLLPDLLDDHKCGEHHFQAKHCTVLCVFGLSRSSRRCWKMSSCFLLLCGMMNKLHYQLS